MEKRYYRGLDNLKDLLFIKLSDELIKIYGKENIELPKKKFEIVEMDGNGNLTGKSHIGYEYHFLNINLGNNEKMYIEFGDFWMFEGLSFIRKKGNKKGYLEKIYFKLDDKLNKEFEFKKVVKDIIEYINYTNLYKID